MSLCSVVNEGRHIPRGHLALQVYIVRVRQDLAELFSVGPMLSLNLAIQLG